MESDTDKEGGRERDTEIKKGEEHRGKREKDTE